MNTTPRVSFVCPSYNHERYVAGFIRSVLAQTMPDWELIIVDDCSTDGNLAAIRKFDDPRIKVFLHDRNEGISAAYNDALAHSSGDIVAFVASDDEVLPEYAETVLSAFGEHAEAGVVYAPLCTMDEDGNQLECVVVKSQDVPPERFFCELFLRENFLPSPGMAMRRAVIGRFAPFPRNLFVYSDVVQHLALAFATKSHYLAKPVVRYRISTKSASWSGGLRTMCVAEVAEYMNYAVKLVGSDIEAFKRHFGHRVEVARETISPRTIPFWMAKLALSSDVIARRAWGLQKIVEIMNDAGLIDELNRVNGLTYGKIIAMMRTCREMPYIDEAPDPDRYEKTPVAVPGIYKLKRGREKVLSLFGLKIRYRRS